MAHAEPIREDGRAFIERVFQWLASLLGTSVCPWDLAIEAAHIHTCQEWSDTSRSSTDTSSEGRFRLSAGSMTPSPWSRSEHSRGNRHRCRFPPVLGQDNDFDDLVGIRIDDHDFILVHEILIATVLGHDHYDILRNGIQRHATWNGRTDADSDVEVFD